MNTTTITSNDKGEVTASNLSSSITNDNKETKMSFFEGGITITIPTNTITLYEVYDMIKSDKYKKEVKRIRQALKDNKKETSNTIKKDLDYITPAVICSTRKETCIQQYSDYACFDADDIKEISIIKKELADNPYIRLLFTSPSGTGLKFIVKFPKITSSKHYRQLYKGAKKYFETVYQIPLDHTDDPARACFMSHDPDAFYNPRSWNLVKIDKQEKKEPKPITTFSNIHNGKSFFDGIKMSDIIGFKSGNFPHPLHGSDGGVNCTMSSDGSLITCWRHRVTINALQYYKIKTGLVTCKEAGTPFKEEKQ